jgi:hypothetical protein
MRACFLGIEPGITTGAELETILDNAGIEWVLHSLGLTGQVRTYSFFVTTEYPIDPTKDIIVFAGNREQTIGGLIIPIIPTPIEAIISSYGFPDAIRELVPEEEYAIAYAEDGIAFTVYNDYPGYASKVDIRMPQDIMDWFIENRSFSPLAPCDDPTQLCGIPTMMPVPEDFCTIIIATGDTASLISAITSANTTPEPDTICLKGGTYTLSTLNNTSDGSNGLPIINTEITIQSVWRAGTITRDVSAPAFPIFNVGTNGRLVLNRLIISGGIRNLGTLELRDSIIENNLPDDLSGDGTVNP